MRTALTAALVSLLVASSATGAAVATRSFYDRQQDSRIAHLERHDLSQRSRIVVLEARADQLTCEVIALKERVYSQGPVHPPTTECIYHVPPANQ